MCGRFTLATEMDRLIEIFGLAASPVALAPRYNIAPSQPVAAVPNDGPRRLDHFLWGLVPSWTRDPSPSRAPINARAEGLADKPSFRNAYRRRRCLIPADGFYEWKKAGGRKKVPHFFRMKSGEPFAFAGLWERWQSPDGSEILSCAIVTTEANDVVAQVHDRMPVILPAKAYDAWLDPGEARPGDLAPLLVPFPSKEMEAWPVSDLVNSPANDSPALIERAPAEVALF